MKPNRKLNHIPEILYEAPSYPGEKTSPIPYMTIPKDKDMPIGLFLMEYKQTGEYEPGRDGKPEEIMDGPYPHMYIEFAYLEEVLKETFPKLKIDKAIDQIRVGLGMLPKKKAAEAGNAILERVVAGANDIVAEKLKTQEERKALYETVIAAEVKKTQEEKK